jgi:hypothetical protein
MNSMSSIEGGIGTAQNSTPAAAKSAIIYLMKGMFSFPAMLGTFFVARLSYELRNFKVDPDLWWHIRVGQDITKSLHWPTADPYSFTVQGTPWMAYEWLGDVAIGFVAQFGLRALAGLLIALGALICIALYYYASLCARNSKAGFVAGVLVSVFAVANFNLRPQMFGALFLAITMIALEHFRQGRPRALWILPPLFLVWVNTHGSWIIGFGAIVITLLGGLFEFQKGGIQGVRWTGTQRRQLELAILGSLAVIPITPYGTKLATYPFFVASSLPLNVAYVQEWLPLPFDINWGKYFLALLAGAFLLQMVYRFTFRCEQWALAIGGTAIACMHVRFVMLFAPFFAPVLAGSLSRWFDRYRPEKDKYVLNFVLMSAAVFALIWYFPTEKELEQSVEKQFPVRAVAFLRAHPNPGRIFNTYGAGGYLIRYLPERKVFIDGRGDLYEVEGVLNDYVQMATLKPAVLSLLDSYRIQTCLIGRDDALGRILAERSEWRQVYFDDEDVIFERNDAKSEVIQSSANEPALLREGGT